MFWHNNQATPKCTIDKYCDCPIFVLCKFMEPFANRTLTECHRIPFAYSHLFGTALGHN